MSTRTWGAETDRIIGIEVHYRTNSKGNWTIHSKIQRLWQEDYEELRARGRKTMATGVRFFPNFEWRTVQVTKWDDSPAYNLGVEVK